MANIQKYTRDDVQWYMHEIAKRPLLTPEEEKKVAIRCLKGDAQAKKILIEKNLRLVVGLARRYVNRGLPLMDLVEEGNLGLIHAVKKYNPYKGARFSTYAVWWIRQSIERAIMNQGRTVRLPVHYLKALSKYLQTTKKLTQDFSHLPTTSEIANEMSLTQSQINNFEIFKNDAVSLDLPINDQAQSTYSDLITDEVNLDPEIDFFEKDLNNKLNDWIFSLPHNQKEVILRRFGLSNYEVMTLDQVGEELELTRERVRQIQVEALKSLKRSIVKKGY